MIRKRLSITEKVSNGETSWRVVQVCEVCGESHTYVFVCVSLSLSICVYVKVAARASRMCERVSV